jgi:predicted Zn-dependent peptidase
MKTYKYITLLTLMTLPIIGMSQIDRSKRPAPGPAPKVKLGKPQTFTLENGLKVLVVEDNKLPRVSINMTLDNDPHTLGEKAGLDDLMGRLLGKGSTKTSKETFEEEIDFMGATLEVYENGAFATGLSRYFDKLLGMLAEAVLMPNFTQEELDKERDRAIEGLKSEDKSVAAIAARVRDVLVFGKNHPFGEFVTPESLNRITLDDVKSYYEKYFVPGKAYMVIMGDVKFSEVKQKVTKYFGSWKKAMPPASSYEEPSNVAQTQINFVDVPNAVQAEVSFVNSVKLTMNDPDYFPVLIANEILGGSFESYLNKTLREKKAWTYGARSSLPANKHVTSFRAGAPLKQSVLDSAVLEILAQIKRIRDEFVSDEDLELAKATFIGDFIRESAKPRSISSFALRIETQGLTKDFYEKYLENIQKVTREDVKRVSNKYFLTNNARIVVAAKASEVIDKLEKTGIPLYYYDKFGNPTEKPQIKKLDAQTTVGTVLAKYFAAIGGEDKVKAVSTMKTFGSASIPGAPAPLSITMTSMKSGYSMMEMALGGMPLVKQVVTPKGGFTSQQGQRKELDGDELKNAQKNAAPFKELHLVGNSNVQLIGIEKVEDVDVYVLRDGDKKYYYDMHNGLKVAESNEVDNTGEKMTVWTYYRNYREVDGIKVPFNIVMNFGFELDIEVKDVVINKEVSEKDFK